MKWEELSLGQKSDLMRIYTRNGISNLQHIKQHYNEYQNGGQVYQEQPQQPQIGKTHIQLPRVKAPGINLVKNGFKTIPTTVGKGMHFSNGAMGILGAVGDLFDIANSNEEDKYLIRYHNFGDTNATRQLMQKYQFHPENMPKIEFSLGGDLSNNHGEVSPEIRHNVEHLTQTPKANNTTTLFIGNRYASTLADGGPLKAVNALPPLIQNINSAVSNTTLKPTPQQTTKFTPPSPPVKAIVPKQTNTIKKEEVPSTEEHSISLKEFQNLVQGKTNLPQAESYNKVIGHKINADSLHTIDDVRNVQEMLVKNGIQLPKSTTKDGTLDGLLGNETMSAINKYNSNVLDQQNIAFKGINKKYNIGLEDKGFLGECTETQCSQFTSNKLYEGVKPNMPIDKFLKQVGMTGDSWFVAKNLIAKGGKMMYDNSKLPGGKSLHKSYGALQPGDVVVMSTGGNSNYQQQASKYGDGNTHSGIIDKVEPDGSYWVRHNVHRYSGVDVANMTMKYQGREYYTHVTKDGFMPGFGFNIRKVVRPNLSEVQDERPRTDDTFNPKNKITLSNKSLSKNETIGTFLNVVQNNKIKKDLMYENGLDENEMNSVFKVVGGILHQESKYGKAYNMDSIDPKDEYKIDNEIAALTKRTGSFLTKGIGNLKNPINDVSHGNASIKKSNFPDNYDQIKRKYDLEGDNDDKTATVLASIIVGKAYKKYKQKGYSPEDAMYRAIVSYNAGTNLNSTKTKVYKTQHKTNEDLAKEYDKDYANKVLLASQNFSLYEGNKEKGTYIDRLVQNKKLQENMSKIPSLNGTSTK